MTLTILLLAGCGTMGLDQQWDGADYTPDDSDARDPYGGGNPNGTDTDPDTEPGGDDGSDGGDGGDGTDTPPDDTGSGGGSTTAPTLTFFNVNEVSGNVEFLFEVDDPDGDLDGGVLTVDVDGVPYDYALGGDLDIWEPTGTSKGTLPIKGGSGCSGGAKYGFEAQVADAVGLTSNTMADSLSLSGSGFTLSEVGDLQSTAEFVGTHDPRIEICGDLHSAANNGNDYTGDMDWIEVRASSSGTWSMELTWSASNGDYDLYLVAPDGTLIDGSAEYGTVQPEVVTFDVTAGYSYFLAIGGWEGDASDWYLDIN